ncbi:thiamine pyrophosphate-binding protein [Microbacterium sp. F2]|uniref:thiamine pyrophosphate-binding protein n=1 Tax=Microbacterium sp. F2 TaxID=3422228 RepID=UPI003FD010A1
MSELGALPSPEWGSDAIAAFLRETGVEYIALNPGASYRGLHDSLVNYLGDSGPTMLMTLHEEHAVAIAHGYAKLSGRPLAVALHSNVGLMHAAMAIYNAYADRVPMLILGAAGPADADRRRPWIDWLHTTADQPAIVRNYVKWDDSPLSVAATLSSLSRAWELTSAPPQAPTYVVLDVSVQEERITEQPKQPRVFERAGWARPVAAQDAVKEAMGLLRGAQRPVILSGRSGAGAQEYADRVRLAEMLGARVVTDLKANSSFPTRHPLHVSGAGFFLSPEAIEALGEADVVVALDWIDLAGALRQAPARAARAVVAVTLDPYLHNGWSKDHGDWPAVDVWLPAVAEDGVRQLIEAADDDPVSSGAVISPRLPQESSGGAESRPPRDQIPLAELADALRSTVAADEVVLARLPLGWDSAWWDFSSPTDYLGYDGGGGIGSGPGMAVGAALAARHDERMVVAVLGDGDFLMGATAVWTGVKYGAAALVVVANNRSYFNDEVHQEKVAHHRDRDPSRKWVGQRIDDPAPDIAMIARAQGAIGLGPVIDPAQLRPVLEEAAALVRNGALVVVDVRVGAGYSELMAGGLVREVTPG